MNVKWVVAGLVDFEHPRPDGAMGKASDLLSQLTLLVG